MLQEMYIKNFVLIDEARIPFGGGMNVLTGETGAGKSIIIDALGLVLGERMKSEYIRDERHRLVTEAVFDISSNTEARAFLLENGFLEEEDEEPILVISREIQAGGKSVSRINGRLSSAGLIRNLAGLLVDLHLQNARHNILSPANYLRYVDSFGEGMSEELTRVSRQFHEYKECKTRLEELRGMESERLQRLDFLDFQVKEIEALALAPGEEEELLELRGRVRDGAALMEGSQEIHQLLYAGSSSAYDYIARSLSAAGKLLHDPFFSGLIEPLNNIYYSLEDLADQLERFSRSLDFEPGTLDRVEQRLYDISRLTRKYGRTGDDLLSYLVQAREERDRLQNSEQQEAELEQDLAKILKEYDLWARGLGKKRQEASRLLEKAVYDELVSLNMPGLRFRVELKDSGTPGPAGYENTEFLFSANPGEELYPVHRIASGGELSRFILALKKVLARVYRVPTMVFDEIDSGLGGSALQSMALKLGELANERQLILITHAPQIASHAASHYVIDKIVNNERTSTRVRLLEDEERTREVARMMGGEQYSELTVKTSREMIEQARLLFDS